jgi:hypothetical protein
MKKLLLFIFSFLAISNLFASNKVAFSPATTFTQVSYALKSPKVDGKISPNEYMYSFENFGTLIHNRAFLSSRQAKYFAAMDGQNLYLACQSEVPEKDTKLKLKKKFKKRDSQIPYDQQNARYKKHKRKGSRLSH